MIKIESNEMKILSTIVGFVVVGFGVYQTVLSIFELVTQTEFHGFFIAYLGKIFFGVAVVAVGLYLVRLVKSDFLNYYQTEIMSGVILVFAIVFGYYLSGMMSNVSYLDVFLSIFGLSKERYIGIPEHVLIAVVIDAIVVLGSAATLIVSYLLKSKNV